MNNVIETCRGAQALKIVTSVREVKECGQRAALDFLVSPSEMQAYSFSVGLFIYNILRDALIRIGKDVPQEHIADNDVESLGYLLDNLLHQCRALPDNWEVWSWSRELQECYGDKLVTSLCPGVGNISIVIRD